MKNKLLLFMLFFASINPSIVFCSEDENDNENNYNEILNNIINDDEDKILQQWLKQRFKNCHPPKSNNFVNPYEIGVLDEGCNLQKSFYEALNGLRESLYCNRRRHEQSIKQITNGLAIEQFYRNQYQTNHRNEPLPNSASHQLVKYRSSPCYPLSIVSELGFPYLVKKFLDAGADPNKRNPDDNTPLHALCDSSDAKGSWNYNLCIHLLLQAGADCNSQGKHGRTPLGLIIIEKRKEKVLSQLVNRLLAAGADPLIKDNEGYNAISIAKLVKDKKVYKLLNDSLRMKLSKHLEFKEKLEPHLKLKVQRIQEIQEEALVNQHRYKEQFNKVMTEIKQPKKM